MIFEMFAFFGNRGEISAMGLCISKYRIIMPISLYLTTGFLFLMLGCHGTTSHDSLALDTKERIFIDESQFPPDSAEVTAAPQIDQIMETLPTFVDHGIAIPFSFLMGSVAVRDQGKGCGVLSWLQDHTGCSSLLWINTLTNETRQIYIPFPSDGDSPFASILSLNNKFYTYFNSHFIEFDPLSENFSFITKAKSKTAMSLTEDDNGLIWAATYPTCGLISYNPKTQKLKDYGSVNEESWSQYPYYIAADDTGWIYMAVGYTRSQIIAFNSSTGKSHAVFPESERKPGMAYLYRDMNGKVYGIPLENPSVGIYGRKPVIGSCGWYELHNGMHRKVDILIQSNPKLSGSGRRDFFLRDLGDGIYVNNLDLQSKTLTLTNSKGLLNKTINFSYKTEGAYIMSVAADPEGRITGGTTFPHNAFVYSPKSNSFLKSIRSSYQWNTLVRHGEHIYIGAYPKGVLLEWLPGKEWNDDSLNIEDHLPRYCTSSDPLIHRPHDLVVDKYRQTIILAGTPDYGVTGGGLLFWNIEKNASETFNVSDFIPHQSVRSLAVLNDNLLLGGTTTAAGTGGLKIADEAELFIMNSDSKKIVWSAALIPGVKEYTDLIVTVNGLVYGLSDRSIFFVFDPETRSIIKIEDTRRFGMVCSQQGQRAFVIDDQGRCYILFSTGIAMVDNEMNIQWVEKTPAPITAGGDFSNGRIYYASGSHLYSCKIDK